MSPERFQIFENIFPPSIPGALRPEHSAVVAASAGTGKTWLLNSRIIRLLLSGAAPGSILAITFTRRAAGEIHQRLRHRLAAFADTDPSALDAGLREIGVTPDGQTRERARGLYENLLTTVCDLRATTFHAFCQDLLTRFPVEAGVPPGFDVCETPTSLAATAWRAMDRQAIRTPDGELAQALDHLFLHCGGFTARKALQEFLDHRSDWWAFTEDTPDAIGHAVDTLRQRLAVASENEIFAHIADGGFRKQLGLYAELLASHSATDYQTWLPQLRTAAAGILPPKEGYGLLKNIFLTQTNRPRVFKSNKALIAEIGDQGLATLIKLHEQIAQQILKVREYLLRLDTLETSRNWFICGTRFLEHYQALKRERKLLDFADLEWQTYRLLRRGQHAEWVQYKLDQRIDHLLVDEFQDTNPTQWQLLLPLLQEMIAGDAARARSFFLVGDAKQSIYGFRRADPGLFDTAKDWLQRHADAQTYTQHRTWRSSPAIVNFVNLLFDRTPAESGADPGAFYLANYERHEAQHESLWGRVELLPLIKRRPPPTFIPALRNPLEAPRQRSYDDPHRHEGDLIAAKIKEVCGKPIVDKGTVRPLDYGDVMVLLRDRNHAHAYEAALRAAGIPYLGTGRGTFTECPEVRDLIQLLTVLVAPFDDLALATALRSPVFSASDQDLLRLAGGSPGAFWYERLQQIAPEDPSALGRAHRLLLGWRQLVDRIPVHDLLDRIFFEGNISARYTAAAPPHLKTRIASNLNRLLWLALEVDSGRFPSLARYLTELDALTEQYNELSLEQGETRVTRVMTIHAAKGLESPVVFLANAAQDCRNRDRGTRALISWPAGAPRPIDFYLIGNKDTLDERSKRLITEQEKIYQREETNLLYVALTRAKQMLFISGCESSRDQTHTEAGTSETETSWYGFMERRLRNAATDGHARAVGLAVVPGADHNGANGNATIYLEHGAPIPEAAPTAVAPRATLRVDPSLTRPLPDRSSVGLRYPSHLADQNDFGAQQPRTVRHAGIAARQRGVVIHRMLQVLSADPHAPRMQLKTLLDRELVSALPRHELDDSWEEACRVIDHPNFLSLYNPAHYLEARNEVSVLYRQGQELIYGIIDRLVIRSAETVVIEYKTHAHAADDLDALTAALAPQLRLYSEGVRKLWPHKRVRALLVFTACCLVVETFSSEPLGLGVASDNSVTS